MSKANKDKPAPVDRHAPVHTDTMSPAKRWTLIGVAVFCLLIFSVTGPMADVLGSWMQGGPATYATLELPDGSTAEIDWDDYQSALSLWSFAEPHGLQVYPDDSLEDILAYAALGRLADAHGVTVTTEELRASLSPYFQNGAEGYAGWWRRMGFQRAMDFEASFARALRVDKMRRLLLIASIVPDEADVLEVWKEDYAEMRFQFVHWEAEQFADQAALLEPEEEELQSYYDEELTPLQRLDLEREEAFAFELALLTREAMQSGAYDAWADMEEPTEEALEGFFNSNRYTLYLRDQEALAADPTLGAQLTREEVGEERLKADYLLHRAVAQLGQDLVDVEADALADFMAERGATLRAFEELVPRSELAGLEDVGTTSLGLLAQGEVGVWQQRSILTSEGLGYVMRPTERRDRAMPELAEVRDEVVGYWREARQAELAEDAALAFMAGLPRAEDALEGDPVVLDAEAFASSVQAAGGELVEVDWVSRRGRPTVDPLWDPIGTRARMRSDLGQRLDDLVDGQVVEPIDMGSNGWAVAHLLARQPADPDSMWPGEMMQARNSAASMAQFDFFAEQISFEAMTRLYGLKKSDDLLQLNP
jgi:hypothetical protein